MSPAYAIGVTGDVGSGKSTVLTWLESRGVSAFDADDAAHQILATDELAVAEVVARFGSGAGRPGMVDRASLAEMVFADPAALADLERIVHPRVAAAARIWLEGLESGMAAIEAVKLIDAGMHAELDEVWLVICDRAERLRRLADRGWSAAEIERRVAAGTPLGPRLSVADVVIDNSGSRDATALQLEVAWTNAVRRAAGRAVLARPGD